jgi:putative phosphoribosyl transferase
MALPGELKLTENPIGMVVFSHGSDSSRHSPRNQFVAQVLRSYGLGTLLLDLLTAQEAQDRKNVFDIPFLGRRVIEAVKWLKARDGLEQLPIGLFGASTGAAAALMAAAQLPAPIAAVVSRGGRPDLARPYLAKVRAPTLLIVGSEDPEVLALNRLALEALACPKKLEVVPGATHLFEEPGTLDVAASLAGHWFERHLTQGNK